MMKTMDWKFFDSRNLAQEKGNTLIIYITILAVLSALALGAIKITSLNLEASYGHQKAKKAFYSAEVGLDLAVNDVITEFENLSVYTESVDFGGDADGYITVGNYRGYNVTYKITNPVDRYLYQTILGNSPIYHYAHTFQLEGNAFSLSGNTRETLNEKVRILETPLVQYFVFYGGTGNEADLEIRPLPVMNGWGRVHSNRDIYVTSYNELNFKNYDDDGNMTPHFVSAAGNLYLKDKADNNAKGGTVHVQITNDSFLRDNGWDENNAAKVQEVTGQITAANEASEEGRFNDYVLVNEAAYNAPSKTQFVRGGFYESRAGDPQRPTIDGIKIVGQGGLGAGNIEVFVSRPGANTDVTQLIIDGESSTGNPIAGLPMPIIREKLSAFPDCREGDDVDLTDIDLYALEQWYEAYLADLGLTLAGDGILIYASRSPNATFTNSGDPMQGIRLMEIDGPNSSPQLSDETTLATDNPIYIKGDFNTVSTKGVALIGDAINMLSNAWNDTKTCSGLPTPTATTVNACFFAGHVPTPSLGTGPWSGGLNNYPRFHEKWKSSIATNISGCFINLWTSTQATGTWAYFSPIYTAPQRNWGWDVRFQDPDFWPPFIPSIFSVERVGFLE